MEEGSTKNVFFHPKHPYTQHLIECIPARVKVIARKHAEEEAQEDAQIPPAEMGQTGGERNG